MKQSLAGLSCVAAFVLCAAAAFDTVEPPPVPDSAAPDAFSAHNALRHLETIARAPHAMGTAEHRRVREYLISEIERLGLAAEVQDTTVIRPQRRSVQAGRVLNVLTRLPARSDPAQGEDGQGEGQAVLLAAHYDTVPTSPGASDDGAGVAALLEVLRIVSQEPPANRELIFLFADGEEPGLLGAEAFMAHHPWAERVGVVANFEARGRKGPALMFETSAGNRPLIRTFENAVPHPLAFSYTYEIYRILPNLTDFTVFRRHGLAGLNFAYIHGRQAYHTALDTVENLDPRSLQHHGETALALARKLGGAEPDMVWTERDSVYFNLLGSWFISYPSALVPPWTVFLAFGVVGAIVGGFYRRLLSAKRLLGAFAAVVVGGAVIWFLFSGLYRAVMANPYDFSLWNGASSHTLYFLASSLMACGLAIGIFSLAGRWLGTADLAVAGVVLWMALTLVLSVRASGASYLFNVALPLTLVAAILLPRLAEPAEGSRPRVPWYVVAVLVAGAALTALLWIPTMALVGVGMGPAATPAAGVLILLILFGLLGPHLHTMPSWLRLATASVCLAAGAALLVAVRSESGFGPENPQPNGVLYTLDTATEEAWWIALDPRPDDWTAQFVSLAPEVRPWPEYLGSARPSPMKPAPVAADLSAAEVEVIAVEAGDGAWSADVRVRWELPVHRATFYLRSDGEMTGLVVDGRELGELDLDQRKGDRAFGTIVYFEAPPAEGVHLRLTVGGRHPLEIETLAKRYDLPRIEGFGWQPRPPDRMPHQNWITDTTLIRSVEILDPDDLEAGLEPDSR